MLQDEQVERHAYELCALSELRSGLRSGDIWISGSHQYKAFEDYLMPHGQWEWIKQAGDQPKDRVALFAALLADAINLGLAKMADAYAGMTFNRLAWVVDWYVRDETHTKALAEVINYHHHPFAAYWGDGTTSSSDVQRFKVGGRSEATSQVNLHYGIEPGVAFYTHISDQYGPYRVKVISSAVRDAPHMIDGLLYHETNLQIHEHYTDT